MKKSGVMLVGLCGRSGSGKGYIAKMFAEYGVPSIDTDAVYREMTAAADKTALSPCMTELVTRFGGQILSPDNSLNRVVMRELVFNGDSSALADLNRITHKHILAETMVAANKLFANGYQIVLVDAPLLFESGFDKMCERVVCVTAPEEVIIRRIIQRDGITESGAKRRLAAQKPVSELEDKADFVISNDDERPVLYERVKRCIAELTKIRSEFYE